MNTGLSRSCAPTAAGFGLHAVDNPRKVLPVWECGLQDEGANRILQLLTAALRTREATDALPRLPHRVRARSLCRMHGCRWCQAGWSGRRR